MTHKKYYQSQNEFFEEAKKVYEPLRRPHRGGREGHVRKSHHQKQKTQHRYKL